MKQGREEALFALALEKPAEDVPLFHSASIFKVEAFAVPMP